MAAPALKQDLPSSPVQRGLYGKDTTKSTNTIRAIFQNKHVLNSMKWGFCSATFITFHTLYHSRGNITLALTFGTLTFCIISPIKYYAYIKRQRHEFFRSLNFVSQTQKSNFNYIHSK